MPIYEYRCDACEATFSRRRSMGDADAPIECESCHSPQSRRLLSRIAAIHKSGNGGGNVSGGSGGCGGCGSHNCGSCKH
jgi:putative FmdB family regulatory protein